MSDPVLIVGGGVGGLACALSLAAQGVDALVLEAADAAGGKLRAVAVDGRPIDAGPTVFTMKWVFDDLFNRAGLSLDERLPLTKAQVLARHAWGPGETFDLFADRERSADAVARFANAQEARRYLEFCAQAGATYETLKTTFMTAQRPSPVDLALRAGVRRLMDANPFGTLWTALGRHFHDPRLRQLFARYATYCGSSPFLAPATLTLVAHVEQEGVWLVEGGMVRLAQALREAAQARGARVRAGATVAEILVEGGRAAGVALTSGERVAGAAVVVNADPNAVATGRLGAAAARAVARTRERSLSALTIAVVARTRGFPLARHSVFFSRDYAREFEALFGRRAIPDEPTIYVCAQDRDDAGALAQEGPERLFILVNAPPTGDAHDFTPEIAACHDRILALLARCGLTIEPVAPPIVTTPNQFEALFPATGGALYGPATHGAMATFSRPAARTGLPGLYLAGGAAHPGPGVPMAALSGRIAAQALAADGVLTRRFHPGATPGGMSTR